MNKKLKSVQYVVGKTLKEILSNLMIQIEQIQMVKTNMNPYASIKINSLINQIGSLLLDNQQKTPKNIIKQNNSTTNQQNVCESDQIKKQQKNKIASKRSTQSKIITNILNQNQVDTLPKDNLMTGAVYVHEKQHQNNYQNSFLEKSQILSSIYQNKSNRSIKQNSSFYIHKKHSTRSKQSSRRYIDSIQNKLVTKQQNIEISNQKDKKKYSSNKFNTQPTQIFTISQGLSNQVHNSANKSIYKHNNHNKNSLISLESSNIQKPRPSRKVSAFEIIPDKILKIHLSKQEELQNLIQGFRIHKKQQQIQKAKILQKQSRLDNLLKKEQTVLGFTYEGDFIKKNKRQAQQILQNLGKGMHVTQGLVPTEQWNYSLSFWKQSQKKKKGTMNKKPGQTMNISKRSHGIMYKDSKNQIQNKKTTSKKLQQLKKLSVQITNKTKVDQVIISSKKSHLSTQTKNFIKSFNVNNTQNVRFVNKQEEKQFNQQVEYLNQNLQKYHQQQKNKMPEWYKNVQKGCSIKIFEQLNNPIKKQRTSLSPKNILSPKNTLSPKNGTKTNFNKLSSQKQKRQIKAVINIMSEDRQQIQLLKQWQQKRQQYKQQQQRKQRNKKSVGQSKSKFQKLLKLQKIQQQNYDSRQNPQNYKLRVSGKHNQSENNLRRSNANKQSQNNIRKSNTNKESNKQLDEKKNRKIHSLTRKQFQFVKQFLQYERKNNIRRNKSRLQTNASQKKLTSKTQGIVRYQIKDFMKNNTSKYRLNNIPNQKSKTMGSYTEGQIQDIKNHTKQISLIKLRAFSVLQRNHINPITPQKRKNLGKIKISNQKLVSSLLQYSSISQLPISSILVYQNDTKPIYQDNLKTNNKNSKIHNLLQANSQNKGQSSQQKSVSFNLQNSSMIQIKNDAFISSNKKSNLEQNKNSSQNKNKLQIQIPQRQNEIKIVQKINKKSQFRNIIMKSNLLKNIQTKMKNMQKISS